MTQEEREIQAREISGRDERLYRLILKYGIHKPIKASPLDDDCFICEREESSPIHGVKRQG